MRHQLSFILLCVAAIGCRTHHHTSVSSAPLAIPDVIPMPLGFAGSPALTPAEIASLRSVLSQREFTHMADLRAALPDGLRFMPVRYALMSPLDANGTAQPYTQTTSVCRLSEDQDLVVIEEDRSGSDIIERCFIRDLPIRR